MGWDRLHAQAEKTANKEINRGKSNKNKSFVKKNTLKILTAFTGYLALCGLVMNIIWIYKLILQLCF